MTIKTNLLKHLLLSTALCMPMAVIMSSCSDDDDKVEITYPVAVTETLPADLPADYQVKSGSLVYNELNTGNTYTFNLPLTGTETIKTGTYNIEGNMVVAFAGESGETERTLRAVATQKVITETTQNVPLQWFFYNPDNTLVFGEIYFAGSRNAAGTNGLYDTYFTIYNNTDSVIYADGIAIAESKFVNTTTDKILTPANEPEANFTAQTIYVIPGSGRDVAINPGESIKIVDQAIDWSAQVAGALNHTDADFEWYDLSSSTSVVDTDNPDVPNLDKWFSYSPTIWIPSNQCNRSYALVRFPEGMTSEKFLAEQDGTYRYINAATGREMTGTKCYLIKNEWIVDGVNLCPDEGFTQGALSVRIDAGHAAISEIKVDKNRFGRKFVRKTSGVSAAGHTILQDTDDSGADFNVVSAN